MLVRNCDEEPEMQRGKMPAGKAEIMTPFNS